jgi:hypothetical protein
MRPSRTEQNLATVLRHVPLSSWVLGAAALAAVASVPAVAHGQRRSRDAPSVFFVAKSENRNQVHYGIHLDEACVPAGRDPLFAYWRMLERGPLVTEPLLPLEFGAYGVGEQHVLARGENGGQVSASLRALAARTITVDSRPQNGACLAVASTPIGGTPAVLTSVYAQLGWPFGVAYLVLAGRSLSDGREVRERVVP